MNSHFLEKAAMNEPKLYEEIVHATRYGEPVADTSKWFQYHFEEKQAPENVVAGDSFYIDFGDHYTGHLSFRMSDAGSYPDSPIKVHINIGVTITKPN